MRPFTNTVLGGIAAHVPQYFKQFHYCQGEGYPTHTLMYNTVPDVHCYQNHTVCTPFLIAGQL